MVALLRESGPRALSTQAQILKGDGTGLKGDGTGGGGCHQCKAPNVAINIV